MNDFVYVIPGFSPSAMCYSIVQCSSTPAKSTILQMLRMVSCRRTFFWKWMESSVLKEPSDPPSLLSIHLWGHRTKVMLFWNCAGEAVCMVLCFGVRLCLSVWRMKLLHIRILFSCLFKCFNAFKRTIISRVNSH